MNQNNLQMIKERNPSKEIYKIAQLMEKCKLEYKLFAYSPIINNHLEVGFLNGEYILFNLHWRFRLKKSISLFKTKNPQEMIGFIKGYIYK